MNRQVISYLLIACLLASSISSYDVSAAKKLPHSIKGSSVASVGSISETDASSGSSVATTSPSVSIVPTGSSIATTSPSVSATPVESDTVGKGPDHVIIDNPASWGAIIPTFPPFPTKEPTPTPNPFDTEDWIIGLDNVGADKGQDSIIVSSKGEIIKDLKVPLKTADLTTITQWKTKKIHKSSKFLGYYYKGVQYVDADGIQVKEINYKRISDLTAKWEDPKVKVADAEEDGYVFDGWYSDALYSTIVDTSSELVLDRNIDLYGKFSTNRYLVTLDAKNSEEKKVITAHYGEYLPDITVPEKTVKLTYSNCNFENKEWNLQFQGYYSNGVQYYDSAGKCIRKWDVPGNCTLVARWSSAAVTITDPVMDGHKFLGWYVNDSSELRKSMGSYQITEDLDLKAIWETSKTSIKLYNTVDETKANEVIDILYGEILPPLRIPKLTGYVFMGYYDRNDLSKKIYAANGKSTVVCDFLEPLELQAKWLKKNIVGTKKLTIGKGETISISGELEISSITCNTKGITCSGVGTNTLTLKGNKIGMYEAEVEESNGGVTIYTVTVRKAPKTIKSVKKVTLRKGLYYKVKASVNPNFGCYRLTWSSANKKIAKVSGNGKIFGMSKGKTKITVKAFNGVKKKITVVVK